MSRSAGTRRKVRVEPRAVPPERPGPEGGVRDATRRARAAAIATAGLQLMLSQGVEAVSIDEIAAKSGLSKGSFYNYFRDKEDLVDALLAPAVAALREAFEVCEAAVREARDGAALVSAYETLAVAVTVALRAHPGVTLLYLQESRAPAVGARRTLVRFAREMRERAVGLTEAAREHRLLRDVDARVTAHTVVGAVEALVFETLTDRALAEDPGAPAALLDLVLHGIVRRR